MFGGVRTENAKRPCYGRKLMSKKHMKRVVLIILAGMMTVMGGAVEYSQQLVKQAEAGDIRAKAYHGWSYGEDENVTKDETEAGK